MMLNLMTLKSATYPNVNWLFIPSLLIGYLLPSMAIANPGENIDKALEVNSNTRVYIDVPRGDVKINGWRNQKVNVKGFVDEKAEFFVFEQNKEELFIKVKLPRKYHRDHDDEASNLEIHVPVTSQVTFKGVTTDLIASELENGLDAGTFSGDIRIKEVSSRIAVETVSGDLEARDLSGKIKIRSISGDIIESGSTGVMNVQLVSGDLKSESNVSHLNVNSVSGDTRVKLQSVEELQIKSVSGDINAQLDLSSKGQIVGSTVSGDFYLKFHSMPDANFTLDTSAGGDITNRLTDDQPSSKLFIPREHLEFKTGEGKGEVDLSTVSGELIITK